MIDCIACREIDNGVEPGTIPFEHTCSMNPVFDFIAKTFMPTSNVASLPVYHRDEELKDHLLFEIRTSCEHLQKFITMKTVRLFTPLDLEDIEEAKSRLELAFQVIKDHQ